MTVDQRGPVGDRQWMLAKTDGTFLSQRTHPRMAQIRPTIEADGSLRVEAPGMESLLAQKVTEQSVNVTGRVWRDQISCAAADQQVNQWFSDFLKVECQLLTIAPGQRRFRVKDFHPSGFEVNFADSAPFLLVTEDSLGDLNSKTRDKVPIDRFRPNIVVSGAPPFREEEWRSITIGDIHFPVLYKCDRCSITMVDQTTGERSAEPLATLGTYRKKDGEIYFGQRMIHQGQGTINLGDAVTANLDEV